MISAVACLIPIGLLMLSRHEHETIPPLRFLVRRLFPKLDSHQRFRRVNLISGVLLAVFATVEVIAFALPRLGKH
jgi:hypothetical protein